jgi:hypothetical protein
MTNQASRISLDELPKILEKSNNLGLIGRYLSSLEEFTSFFLSVQQLLRPDGLCQRGDQELPYASKHVRKRAAFEASRARNKILHEQNLCKSYMAPFDNIIQTVSRRQN